MSPPLAGRLEQPFSFRVECGEHETEGWVMWNCRESRCEPTAIYPIVHDDTELATCASTACAALADGKVTGKAGCGDVSALEREARALAGALAGAVRLACEGNQCASAVREVATLGEAAAASPPWAFRGVRRQTDLAMAVHGASVAVFESLTPPIAVGLACARGLDRDVETDVGCGLVLDVEGRRVEFSRDPDHSVQSVRVGATSITVDRQRSVHLPAPALRIRAR